MVGRRDARASAYLTEGENSRAYQSASFGDGKRPSQYFESRGLILLLGHLSHCEALVFHSW
ncbi:hypothetical protein DPEC_G00280060 [Dallia pectoralis]|uniref:Uncharacterized protein n=1 Tax=Dallia pectoralis TaxID=75939 RepID=A0ACC2FMX3_DALPE|nr:hypothetical protein DPEC_G00280060 [Dallia pectoralis]